MNPRVNYFRMNTYKELFFISTRLQSVMTQLRSQSLRRVDIGPVQKRPSKGFQSRTVGWVEKTLGGRERARCFKLKISFLKNGASGVLK